ncbi:MAG: phosphonate ABC transporter, permease protein PhnE [Alphaproteobacteria bacterium]|nr:phosphonate ABC transporter, permease protein PhnE [Alphaproteobacteria bacterium]MCW5741046.1 phosphonate ABC transporter, permease protein PhnE [Alphaproteobacteria bacterium]
MTTAIQRLPEAQEQVLARAYAQAVSARRMRVALGGVILIVLIALSARTSEVDVGTFVARIGSVGDYFDRLLRLDSGQRVWTDVGEWFWGLGRWSRLLFDTLLIAWLGTFLGAIGGFCLCFVAAENLTRSRAPRFAARRFLESCRTVPEIVFALIFVVAFGLGALPGVLAIAIHTVGAMGKLFAEVVENIDMNPVEGATASGASWTQTVRFAVVPQVLPNFASYALLRFEINVRGAAVMGFVGAGGIGQDLVESIRKFHYSDVSAILLIIIATVMVIDLLTERLRHHLIGVTR